MGRPKALLRIGEHTFLENILSAIARSHAVGVVTVLGHHRAEIEKSIKLENSVFNSQYESGMITSIQTGIRALPRDVDEAMLYLVDHPVVHVGTRVTLSV